MNELSVKAKLLFKGFTELTPTEQAKLLEILRDYDSGFLRKITLSEALSKSLGPMNINSCPVCGK